LGVVDVGTNRSYGLVIQRFDRSGRGRVVEAYVVERSDLWTEVRDKLRSEDSPLSDQFVALNDGALPSRIFRGLRKLVSSHNKAVDKKKKSKRERKSAM
tara:strand:- start:64 stop:360 length:297 start_codon:yes stop_codon:yes gene_type:complete